jgi:hypothetical protein
MRIISLRTLNVRITKISQICYVKVPLNDDVSASFDIPLLLKHNHGRDNLKCST